MTTTRPPLTRDQKIAVVGVILTVVAIAVTVLVGAGPGRVACDIHFGTCDRKSAGSSTTNSHSAGPGATSLPSNIVDAAADPNLPRGTRDPVARSLGPAYPVVSFAVPQIVNRGIGVAEVLSGDQFDAYTDVRLEWFRPGGGTFLGTDAKTDERGLFSTALIWRPLQGTETTGGLYGAWKLVATDLTSGRKALAQVVVSSDAQTPPESSWDQSVNGGLKPIAAPSLSIGTTGRLCSARGAEAQAWLQGFTPGAALQLDYYRADGEREMSAGAIADGQGQVMLRSYWTIDNCNSATTFTYHALAYQLDGKIQLSADVDLTTK